MTQQINIPKNWDNILVDQFISIKSLDLNDKLMFNKSLEILSILTDTLPDDEIWEDMDTLELIDIINGMSWLGTEPSKQYKETVLDFSVINIKTMSLGEFIDLDYLFSDNYFTNLPKIIGILYRKTRQNDWGNVEFEAHGSYNSESRGELFLELPITTVYGIIQEFLDFKTLLNTDYQPLFEPVIEETDEDYNEEGFDADEQLEIEREKINKKWSWENILHLLSGGDITKYDKLTELPAVFIFNQLGFRKEMNL